MPFVGAELPLNYIAKLDDVIALIEAPGRWTKRVYKNDRGQYCLKEALNIVGVVQIFEPLILRAAAEAADRKFCSIESFNDLHTTTHADVVSVLRRIRDDVVAGRISLPVSAVPSRESDTASKKSPTAGGWLLAACRKINRAFDVLSPLSRAL